MIRPATEADVPAILAIYAPYVQNTTVTFEYDVPCAREFMRRFLSVTEKFPWLVWEEKGELLGYAYAAAPFERAAYAWCAEPSIYIKEEARGRGIGKRLYAALEAILRHQGYQLLLALITGENTDSLRFHEACGYTQNAHFADCGFKFGRWMGVIWMEKRLKTVEIPSSMPVKWVDFRRDAQKISDILDTLSLS